MGEEMQEEQEEELDNYDNEMADQQLEPDDEAEEQL